MSAGMSTVQFTPTSLGGDNARQLRPSVQARLRDARIGVEHGLRHLPPGEGQPGVGQRVVPVGPGPGIGGQPAASQCWRISLVSRGTSRGRSGMAPHSWASTTWS